LKGIIRMPIYSQAPATADHPKPPAPPSVHVAILDEQHKRLFDLLHRTETLSRTGGDSAGTLLLLRELVDYSDYHFRTEDAYMIDNNYPLFLSHRKEHGQYLFQMNEILTRFENQDPALPDAIHAFLSEWWRRHVMESDMRYARYFKNNPP
jgi:hemerythrin